MKKLKSLESIAPIYQQLINLKCDRNTTIIAIGGGALGDAIGYIASTFLRGVSWVCIPTTLLSQVDSSVGGKDRHQPSRLVKILIGTFHRPRLVVCASELLKNSYLKETYLSGFGEIIKHGLILDSNYYFDIVKNWEALKEVNLDLLSEASSTAQYKLKGQSGDS